MPKFTLIAEHRDMFGNPLTKTTHEFEYDYIGDVLENIDLFLRGTGYNQTGTLDYVQDEPMDDIGHSEFYFDTDRNA